MKSYLPVKLLLVISLFSISLYGNIYDKSGYYPPLPKPLLRIPSNGSAFQVPGVNLVWEAVQGATSYKLKIASDPGMVNIVFKDDNVTGTSKIPNTLAFNTSYYWTIQASNGTETSAVSDIYSFKTMPENPNAVNTHPRLWITQADLPKLQSWASNSNPIYGAMQAALNTAIANYNTVFFPGGQPNPNWPDNGGITWSGYVTESYAEYFAFWSLIDPDPAMRIIHAQRARRLLMYVIDEAASGYAQGVPFRDPQFMTYDRSRVYGEAFGLTVDWIYNAKDANNNNILTSEDKSKIRKVFMSWCNDQLTAYNHPTPIGIINDKQLLVSKWVLNNYYSGHARNMTLMSMALDESDDPLQDQNLPASALGNTLRSYLFNATGAWLYQQYAMYEVPEIVATDYGISPNLQNLGYGSGGLPVEGALYGESLSFVAGGLLALKTAGWDDENIIGKQAKLISSNYWPKFMDGLLHSVTPEAKVYPEVSYAGPLYQAACYGDLLRTWITPEYVTITGTIGLLAQLYKNQNCLDKTRWYSRNVIEGGAGKLNQRISYIWPNSYPTNAILYFMLLDPNGSNPPDPRPDMPVSFNDEAFHRLLSRTDWSPDCNWFDWHCHWTTINHQSGDNNQFEFYRKGEWLIKERSGYTNDGVGYTSEFHNTVAIQNDVPSNLQWFEGPTSERGGQWTNGVNAGDPNVLTSIHEDFVYATGVSTNLYNRPNPWTPSANATDVLHASRSLIWLKPDHIVVYDRVISKSEDKFKRFFLQFTAPMIVNGKNGEVNTPGGQKLYLTNLLPDNSVLTPKPSEIIDALAELEPTTDQIKIEDPSNPKDIRFLNVLQGADAGASKDGVSYLKSIAGNVFEGVILINTVVLFPNVWDEPFDSTVYIIPPDINKQIITGLTPNGGYSVTSVKNGNVVTITIVPGDELFADSGGVLIIDKIITSVKFEDSEIGLNLNILPNPASQNAIITYDLESKGEVSIQLLDLTGKHISELVNKKPQEKGKQSINFNVSDLPSGSYLIKLTTGSHKVTKPFVVTK